MRRIVAYCLVISLGTLLLMHFIPIWIHDSMVIKEDNIGLRTFETIMSVTILLFGIERFTSVFRR